MKINLEEVKCLCGVDDSIILFIIQLIDSEPAKIVKCKNCGLIYISPRPTPEFFNWMYREKYYNWSIDDKDTWTKKTFEIEIEREKIHLYGLKPIFKMQEHYGYKTLLDIGTGAGYFLKLAKDKGFDVLGTEISERALEFAKKNYEVPVLNISDIREAKLKDSSFDVVALCHVIEHLLYPQHTIKEIHRILSNNGRFLIVTPNYMALATILSRLNRKLGFLVKPLDDPYTIRIWKNECYYLSPKITDEEGYKKYLIGNLHHIYFFNPKTLKEFLLRCNFSVDVYPVGGYNRGVKGIRRLFSNLPINLLARIFNLQTEIVFYARKI